MSGKYPRELFETARSLIERGLPIIAADAKKPLGGKSWHQRKFSVAEIARLLDRAAVPQIGLCLGPKSCLDIEADGRPEEIVYQELFDGADEPLTPTFQSVRGLHRLFQFDPRLETTGRGILYFRGKLGTMLGIRTGGCGKAAQSIIPPSNGRTWLPGRSLDECKFAALPEEVVDRILAATSPYSNDSQIVNQEQEENTNHSYESQPHTLLNTIIIDKYCLCPPTLEAAIKATVPSRPGVRNRRIFEFARHVMGMREYQSCSGEELRHVVRQWHSRALPFIGTKDFAETWRDFLVGWGRVEHPIGAGTLGRAVREAICKPAPAAAAHYDDPDLKKLISVCCELQRTCNDKPFYLSCRTAASYVGGGATHKTRWSKYLNRLCADGLLRLHSKGSRSRASEYFYLGDKV